MPILLIIISVILTGVLLYLYKRARISNISEEQQPQQQTEQITPQQMPLVSKLDNYISTALRRGYTEEQIKDILVGAGWDSDILEMSFRKFRNKFNRAD